jgi:trehalose-6-phosphatase
MRKDLQEVMKTKGHIFEYHVSQMAQEMREKLAREEAIRSNQNSFDAITQPKEQVSL